MNVQPTGYVDAHWQRFMVAEREDGVLGMYDLEGEYLHAIHVHPDAIGSGVGRALMDHAEEGGAKALDVRIFNQNAIGFYLHRGWREADQIDTFEMGTPTKSILMVLQKADQAG